jgi:hypothetical protein
LLAYPCEIKAQFTANTADSESGASQAKKGVI